MKNDRTYQTNLDHIWTTEDYLHFFENSKMICDFAENFRGKFEIDFQVFREDFKRLREFAKPVDKITKLKENVFIFRLTDMDVYQVTFNLNNYIYKAKFLGVESNAAEYSRTEAVI